MVLVLTRPVSACGWWGDGETEDLLGSYTVRADGVVVNEGDWARESPEEMLRIGNRFRTGSGGLLDLPMAVKWYRAAAELGFAPAQYNLAMMYERGLSVARDYSEAARWYRNAAEQGDVHAQHHLGKLYQHGRGVPLDPVSAAHWYVQAAEQGHADVFATVAGLYRKGIGVHRDDFRAQMWRRLAAEHGDASVLEDMRAAGAELGPEGEARVQDLVDEWKRRRRQVRRDSHSWEACQHLPCVSRTMPGVTIRSSDGRHQRR